MIALVDYGAGNLASVRKALRACGADVVEPVTPADLDAASAIVLPGVGHFAATAALDGRWREAHPPAPRGRCPVSRHLPGHAVALRGQRRSAVGRQASAGCPAASRACRTARRMDAG